MLTVTGVTNQKESQLFEGFFIVDQKSMNFEEKKYPLYV